MRSTRPNINISLLITHLGNLALKIDNPAAYNRAHEESSKVLAIVAAMDAPESNHCMLKGPSGGPSLFLHNAYMKSVHSQKILLIMFGRPTITNSRYPSNGALTKCECSQFADRKW